MELPLPGEVEEGLEESMMIDVRPNRRALPNTTPTDPVPLHLRCAAASERQSADLASSRLHGIHSRADPLRGI